MEPVKIRDYFSGPGCVFMGIGLLFFIIGIFLTISIIGAILGIPIMIGSFVIIAIGFGLTKGKQRNTMVKMARERKKWNREREKVIQEVDSEKTPKTRQTNWSLLIVCLVIGIGVILQAIVLLSVKNNISKRAEPSRKIFPDSTKQTQVDIFTDAKNLLTQNKPALAIERLEVIISTGLHSTNDQEIKKLLLECLNQLVESDLINFRKGMELLLRKYPEIIQSKDLMAKYLYGVYLWRFDSKNQAFVVLRGITTEITLPCLNFISEPIPLGKYPITRRFKHDKSSYRRDFTFTITSIEVPSPDAIVVNITVRNHTRYKQNFTFPRSQKEKEQQLEEADGSLSRSIAEKRLAKEDNFYLLNDFGNKIFANHPEFYFHSTPNRQPSKLLYPNVVIMDPGQEITESLTFPMTTLDNTSITFISPGRHGSRPEIKFEDIVLRKVRFSKFPSN